MKLVSIHLDPVRHTNYLVLLRFCALFFCPSCYVNIFMFVFVMILCSLSNVSITVSPSALSLDVVPSVLRCLLAIKNCFYRLIKCFYFHLTGFLCPVSYVGLVQKADFWRLIRSFYNLSFYDLSFRFWKGVSGFYFQHYYGNRMIMYLVKMLNIIHV